MSKFNLENPKKTVSASTDKQYRSKLNNLAKQGYENPQQLLDNPDEVVKKINELTSSRQQLCLYYSAIFYAIGDQNFKTSPKTKAYYDAFRKIYYTAEYNNPFNN